MLLVYKKNDAKTKINKQAQIDPRIRFLTLKQVCRLPID